MNKNAFSRANLRLSDISSRISNRTYFLMLVISFVIDIVIYHKKFFTINVDRWHTQLLTMDYSHGFIRRALLGQFTTLLKNLFNTDYISAIILVQTIGIVLFGLSMLLFFYSVLKDNTDKSFCFIVLLYISLHHWGFELNLFGLLDTYLMVITLLMVYLIIKGKGLFLIPILAGICILIHEAYPLMFFGVIVAVLIYRFCYAEDKAAKRRYLITFLITGMVVSVLFFLSYFVFARIKDPDVDAILASCREKLGSRIQDGNIMTLWIDPRPMTVDQQNIDLMWSNGKPTYTFFLYLLPAVLNLVVCSPLLMLVVLFWKEIIKKETVKFRKILLFLCSISVFLILPLIITHTDQGRWFYDIVFFEIIVIGGICLINSNNERETLSKLTKIGILKILMILFYSVFYFQLVTGQVIFVTVPYILLLSKF